MRRRLADNFKPAAETRSFDFKIMCAFDFSCFDQKTVGDVGFQRLGPDASHGWFETANGLAVEK
jgi:hypothetical protein